MASKNLSDLLLGFQRAARGMNWLRSAWNTVSHEILPEKNVVVSCEKGILSHNSRHMWDRVFPFSPEVAHRILTCDLEGPIEIKVNFDCKKGIRNRLSLTHASYHDTRKFDFRKRTVVPGFIHVEPELRGRGIGRKVMRNEVELFRSSGKIDMMTIKAGAEAGAYTWSRFGFLPSHQSYSQRFNLESHIRRRYGALRPLLTSGEEADLVQLIGLKKPEDIWALADCRIDLGTRLRNLYHDASCNVRKDCLNTLIDTFSYEYSSGILICLASSALKGNPVPAGRFLLAGNKWDGVLDFNNPRQMERARNYVGGWKYIGFEKR